MAGRVNVVSSIGAAAGGLSSFAVTYYQEGFICLHAIANGILAGLVSVTAGANVLHPETALITGVVGGLCFRFASAFILKLGIDDPLEASPIHGFCGIWGLLAVGLFANDHGVVGLFYGNHMQLWYQICGAIVITVWSAGFMGIVLGCCARYSDTLLRVPMEIELAGDFVLYNGSAYPEFDNKGPVAPPSGQMVVVITDVQDSATLAAANPDVTKAALEVEEEILRNNLARFNGYETTAEADSMSAVFTSALDAVGFCLTAQQDLMVAEWPEELFDHPSACKDGKLFCGLRVRMVIHSGNGVKFMDSKVNRIGYKGPVVEETAEILKAVEGGGLVLISSPTFQDLLAKHSAKLFDVPAFIPQDMGEYLLPKVPDPVGLLQIMPTELAKRPCTKLSGCVKLSSSYAEAPGVISTTKGKDIPFLFLSLKFMAGAKDKAAASEAKPAEKSKRASRSSSVATRAPKNALANEQFLADLLRDTAFAHKGYVSKTSNGVSLLTFHEASEALRFVRDIAAAVATKKAEGKVLQFAAGLHVGTPATVAPGKASGRADYLGQPVNATARVMGLTNDKTFKSQNGGFVAVSQPAWEALDAAEKEWLSSVGSFSLKGMKTEMNIYSYDGKNTQSQSEVTEIP